MSTPRHISQLLDELEQETPEMAFQQMADGEWLLAWSDHTIVHLEFDSDEDRLTLSTGVGQPDPDQESAVYKSLLSYNSLWSETGGVTMGVLEDDIVQFFTTCGCRLTTGSFGCIVRNFVAKALIWRIWVALGEVDQPPTDAPFEPDAPAEPEPHALYV